MTREGKEGGSLSRDTDKNITTILANESVRLLCRKLSCYLLFRINLSNIDDFHYDFAFFPRI